MAPPLGILIPALLVSYTLLIIGVTLALRPRIRGYLDRGKVELIEASGNDRGSSRKLVKIGREGYQSKEGVFVKAEADYVTIDRDTGRRRIVYDGDTGFGWSPKGRSEYPEMDGVLYAASLASKNIERVQRSHGGINWTQLAIIAGFTIVLLVGVIGWILSGVLKSQNGGT